MIDFASLDAWTLRVPVTDATTGAAMDLTGGSAVAVAKIGGSAAVALPVTMAPGMVLVEIAAGTLTPGNGAIEVRLSLPGNGTQTARSFLTIARSMQAA